MTVWRIRHVDKGLIDEHYVTDYVMEPMIQTSDGLAPHPKMKPIVRTARTPVSRIELGQRRAEVRLSSEMPTMGLALCDAICEQMWRGVAP